MLHDAAAAADALAAVEHRCMQLVMLAEAKAQEDRAALEARIGELESGDESRFDALRLDVGVCERQLSETAALLGTVVAEFGAAHESSHRLIRQLVDRRAAGETSSFQRIKVALAEFRDYRREMKRNALWRIAKLHELQRLHQEEGSSGTLLSQVLSHEGESVSGASVAPGTSALAYRNILSDLKQRFIANSSQHDADDEVPFLLDAVYAYLVGAIETIGKFGDTIAAQLHRAASLDANSRRNFLLDEERDIFRRRIRQEHPASAVHEINNEAISRVFLERLVDQRVERSERVQSVARDVYGELRTLIEHRLERGTSAFVQLISSIAHAAISPTSRVAAGASQTSHPQSATAGDPDSSQKTYHHTHGAWAAYRQLVGDMEGRIFTRLVEHHSAEYARSRGTLQTAVTELRQHYQQQSNVSVTQNVTVFSIDQLTVERDHRVLLNKAMATRNATLEQSFNSQTQALTDRVSQLTAALDDARNERALAERAAADLQAELTKMQALMQVRRQSNVALHTDVKQVTYEINYASFGETWQESLLNMRSRIHNEIKDENMRLVAKISNMIRAHLGDETQTEQLYEARLHSVVQELKADNERKLTELKRRFVAERQLLHDECELRVRAAKDDAVAECDAFKARLDADYTQKVKELDTLFEGRVRQFTGRHDDAVGYFESKMIELKRRFRDRENMLEIQAAQKDIEVARQYEAEAATLKAAVEAREHHLEAERLKIMTSVESKIHDKVMQVRRGSDFLLKQLQETVFAFAERQRAAFEEQRAKEHLIFSHFMFGSIRTHQEHGQLQLEEANRRVELEALDALKRQAEALRELQRQHHLLKEHAESTFVDRAVIVKGQQEQMLRATQDIRCEQDAQFWATCAGKLRDANAVLIKAKADAEAVMQQRYIDIVARVNQYLQNDVMSAHQTFERECRMRQKQLQTWVNHFHRIALHTESLLWLEVCGRGAIEKEYFSIMSSLRIMQAEERRTRLYRMELDEQPFAEIRTITYEELNEVRETYERLLEQQQEFSANLSHDYLTALSAALREQQQTHSILKGIFTSRLEALATGLKDRFAVYSECRDSAINKELQRIVDAVSAAAVDFVREQFHSAGDRESDSYVEVLDDECEARSPRATRVAGKSKRARSAGASIGPRVPGLSTVHESTANAAGLARGPPGTLKSRKNVTVHIGGPENLGASTRRRGLPLKAVYGVADESRLVEYFSSLRAILSKAFADLDRRVHHAMVAHDEERNTTMRQMHDAYLDASAAAIRALEERQCLIDERDCAIVQLAARLEAKSATEVRAAVLSEDLAAIAQKYDSLSRGWMLHASVNRSAHDVGNAAIEKGGQGTCTPGKGDGRVMLAFTTGLGGKRPTRDAVLENIAMRERLVANEWFDDDVLRESMTRHAIPNVEVLSPPRTRKVRERRRRVTEEPE
jgi:hypothetical protein